MQRTPSTLYIPLVNPKHSGTYICEGYDKHSVLRYGVGTIKIKGKSVVCLCILLLKFTTICYYYFNKVIITYYKTRTSDTARELLFCVNLLGDTSDLNIVIITLVYITTAALGLT